MNLLPKKEAADGGKRALEEQAEILPKYNP
jgi:hypothetical protein